MDSHFRRSRILSDANWLALLEADAGDDVVALVLVELGDSLEREVVGLGRAGGEDDFLLTLGADELGDLLARVAHRFLGGPAEGVAAARRVAELAVEVRREPARSRSGREAMPPSSHRRAWNQ